MLIMIFIVMANGNGRPPVCKIQEARTGNYVLIWSGLNGAIIQFMKVYLYYNFAKAGVVTQIFF